MKMNLCKLLIAASLVLGSAISVNGQDAPAESDASALAKETANPLATVISLPIQFNFNFGAGEYNRFQSVTNLMPVVPARIGPKVNLVNRVIIPIIYQPDVTQESGGTYGVGNINYSAFFTPAKAGKVIWGIGPAFSIPTRSSNMLGTTEFGIGPTLIVLTMPGNWALGFTANNVTSYENGNLNSLFAQVFIVYTFKSAWFVQTMPTITANWNAPEGQEWTVPLGANVGKLVMFGKQPVKFIGGGAYYVKRPDNGAKWQMFFQTVFLFPKKAKS